MAHEQPGTNNQEKIATVGQFAEWLSKEEKAQAAADFDDLVQDTLLRFAGEANTYDHTVRTDRVKSRVLLYATQGERTVTILTESATLDDGTQDRIISLSEWGGDRFRYHLEDGVVRRFDTPQGSESQRKIPKELTIGRNLPLEEAYERAPATVDHLKNELANQKLERQMGINDQPVDTHEVAQLRELLATAEHRKLY
jgi:hypothetical protein